MSVTRYRLVLTGIQNGLADLPLPMSSFQARYSVGGERFVSAVIPNAGQYIAEINLRPAGDIQIYRAVDGVEALLTDANFNQLPTTESPTRTTAQMGGTRQEANTTPVTITIDRVFNRTQQANGLRRLRIPVQTVIRPGDSFVDESVTYLVDNSSVIVNAALGYMEIAGG